MKGKLKISAFVLALALLFNILLPTMRVMAFASTNSITITFRDGYTTEQGTVQYSIDDGASWVDVTSNINNQPITMAGDNLRIRIVPNSGYGVDFSGMSYRENNSPNPLSLNNNANSSIAGGLTSTNGYLVSSDVTSVELASVEFSTHGVGPSQGNTFSGSAWFLWNDNGTLCKYHATDLTGAVLGSESVYPINYIRESDVVDGDHKLEISNMKAGDYAWTWDEKISAVESFTTWSDLMSYTKYLEDEVGYDAKREFLIDPTGAIDAANTLCTNGDRNFRVTIYDEEKYEGITFGTNEEDYTYFLDSWDPVFFSSTFDVSGTTKESPMECSSYMLEPYMKFRVSENSIHDIASVKALDVNDGAVTITKSNGQYTIKFNSNYYDKVEFEVTDTAGNKYYFLVNRIIAEISDTFGQSMANNESTVKAKCKLIYDKEKSYEDYQVIANVTYKDGTVKTETIQASEVTEQTMDGSFVTDYEFGAGKNLLSAYYLLEVTEDMSSVDFTVLNNGALDGENYGGTFAGSGKGIHMDLTRLVNDFYRK